MLGFIVGTVCLIGLVKVLRFGRGHRFGHGYGYGYGGYGGCGGRGGDFGFPGGSGRRRGFGGGWFFRSVFERLGTTPGQEKVILSAADELRDVARKQREELDKARTDVANALRGESFDESAAARASVGFEESARSMKDAVLGALRKVHESLTDEQRRELADLLERGRGGFGRGWGGPYRGGSAWM